MKRFLGILGIGLVFAITQGNAQTMVTGGIDTVATGSQTAYAVDRDANVALMVGAGILDASHFDWTVSGGIIDAAWTTDGTTGLYTTDSITVTWGVPNLTANVSTAESSIRNGSVVCTDATPESMGVVVVALPTVQFPLSDSGNCAAQDYDVPMTLTGYGPWEITYDIDYTDLLGNTSNVSTGTVANIGTVGNAVGSTTTNFDLSILTAQLGAGTAGTYTITITNVDDRYTNKSITDIDGSVITAGGVNEFDIYVYPTPTTSPIRHIAN